MVETLFPIQSIERQNIEIDENEYSMGAIDLVTDNEVVLASERFGNAKAPGSIRPFTEVYNKCFGDGVFPRILKI